MIIEILILTSIILIIIFNKKLNLDLEKYIKLFFILFLVCAVSSIVSTLNLNIIFLGYIGSFVGYFAFGLVLLHSSKELGIKKTSLFFFIMLLFGLFSEVIGVKYGLIFGSYYYTYASKFFFGIVPLMTPITWAILIYVSYTITNLFLYKFGGEKPNKKDKFWYLIALIVLLSSIDGLIAVNMDMILDPISVSKQSWVWIGGGPYFGIPLSNFIGWFFVTFSATFIFRFSESFSYNNNFTKNKTINYSFYVFSIYLMYFLIDIVKSIKIDRLEYVLIGITTMGPFIIILVLMYFIKVKGDNN